MITSERQQIFAKNVSLLIQEIFDMDYKCTFGEAYRTPEQAAIYSKEGKGIVDSQHCKRLAIDLNLFSPSGEYLKNSDDYKSFGTYWESLHQDNKWGGNFKMLHGKPFSDPNHFEMRNV